MQQRQDYVSLFSQVSKCSFSTFFQPLNLKLPTLLCRNPFSRVYAREFPENPRCQSEKLHVLIECQVPYPFRIQCLIFSSLSRLPCLLRVLPCVIHSRSNCNSCKFFAYSFRSTRETLDTDLFTLRKFVFTVTLIHECS